MHPNYNYHYNMIKGRVAEAIIKELFQVNRYRVYEYGMERTLPTAVENVKWLTDELACSIRFMPDFLVQHIETGVLNYVEVKYRANGSFSLKDIENNPYKNTYFIIISKENIQVINYNELENGITLPETEDRNLENYHIFKLDKKLIAEYKEYSKAFFMGVK